MRLLSIDCGIKTMAICLVNINQLEKDYFLVVKLIRKNLEEIANKIHLLRNKVITNKFFSIVKKLNSILIEKQFEIILWKRINIFAPEGCFKNPNCPRPLEFEGTNPREFYCSKHKSKNAKQIKITKVRQTSQFNQSLLLHRAFNLLGESILKVDYVLIEQQPSKNQMMKSIQMKIHEYFIVRGVLDNRFIKHIYFVSPKKKLKSYQLPEEKELIQRFFQTSKATNQYRKNKDVSVKMTLSLLEKTGQTKQYHWLKELSNSIADDLADCFLQAYCYYHSLKNT